MKKLLNLCKTFQAFTIISSGGSAFVRQKHYRPEKNNQVIYYPLLKNRTAFYIHTVLYPVIKDPYSLKSFLNLFSENAVGEYEQ